MLLISSLVVFWKKVRIIELLLRTSKHDRQTVWQQATRYLGFRPRSSKRVKQTGQVMFSSYSTLEDCAFGVAADAIATNHQAIRNCLITSWKKP